MTHPSQDGSALPYFQNSPGGGGPIGPGGPGGPGDPPGPGARPGKRPVWPLVLGGCGCLLVLLVVVAVVLALTVLRPSGGSSPEGPSPTAAQRPTDEERTAGEYVPEGEDPTEDPTEQVTHLPAPTAQCEFPEQDQDGLASGPTRTSGELSFTVPDGWGSEVDWDAVLPYATDVESADQPADGVEGYYSVAQVGRVAWSDAQGGYPGAEKAATAYLQCHLSRPEAADSYGEDPELSAFVSTSIEVDGHPGWIVRGTVAVPEDAAVTWSAVEIVAVVVDSPEGPAVFKASAATDDPQLTKDMQSMIDSLSVG